MTNGNSYTNDTTNNIKIRCGICDHLVDSNKCLHNSYRSICEECLRNMSQSSWNNCTGLIDSFNRKQY